MFIVGKCNLADRLKKAGLTQTQLAIKTGVPKSSITDYIKETHTMSLLSAKKIAHVLNCNIEDLYEWESVGDDKRR